jgi:hypothetical protein
MNSSSNHFSASDTISFFMAVYYSIVRLSYICQLTFNRTHNPTFCEIFGFAWKRCIYMETLHLHRNTAFTWKHCIYIETLHLHRNAAFTWKRGIYMETLHLHGNAAFAWNRICMETLHLHGNAAFAWKRCM